MICEALGMDAAQAWCCVLATVAVWLGVACVFLRAELRTARSERDAVQSDCAALQLVAQEAMRRSARDRKDADLAFALGAPASDLDLIPTDALLDALAKRFAATAFVGARDVEHLMFRCSSERDLIDSAGDIWTVSKALMHAAIARGDASRGA